MSDKVSITFIKKCAPYNAKEIAGFSAERAEQLVNAKCAKYTHPILNKMVRAKVRKAKAKSKD